MRRKPTRQPPRPEAVEVLQWSTRVGRVDPLAKNMEPEAATLREEVSKGGKRGRKRRIQG